MLTYKEALKDLADCNNRSLERKAEIARLRKTIAVTATYLANCEYKRARDELDAALQPKEGEK